ncbi:hypothetical protein EPN42_12090 [bacterium]|nr:MAG: hypothetical protein EPN42_12090 [bacterium]
MSDNVEDTACEICCDFDTGPLQERSKPYVEGEGTELDPKGWTPFVRAVQCDDGWVAAFEADDDEPWLICPWHARGEPVPRREATFRVGNRVIDLQEFDFIGCRDDGDIFMFKHVATRRYFNVAERGEKAVWCDYHPDSGVTERGFDEGLAHARAVEPTLGGKES